MKELLSIKEFAELAGVSKQAIYFQLDSRLQPYLVQVENKKMLKSSALEKFYGFKFQSNSSQVDKPNSSQVDNGSTAEDQKSNGDEAVLQMLEMLKEEIRKKDKQIERLQDSLDKAYMTIGDLANKAQYITSADKTAQIMDKQQQKDKHKDIIEEPERPEKAKKERFWSKLLKK